MKKVVACIITTAFLFGTMEIALKLGGSTFDSLQLTGLRFLIGGAVLAPMAIKEYNENFKAKGKSLSRKDFGWLFLVGCMCIPVSMLLFQLGIEKCNASTAASIMCLNPIFTMAIAATFTNEHMDRNKYCSVVLGIIACMFMMRPWDIQEGNTLMGLLFVLGASITFGAYTVMGKKSLARIGTFTQTCVSFIMGAVVLLTITALSGRPVFGGIAESPLLLAYIGVVVTGIGYLTYFIAIKYSDATTGSLTFFVKPAIAPVLAVIILHEQVMWNTILGILLLLSASFITIRDAFKQKKEISIGENNSTKD
ncbi:MAG: DMT family transporter [Emergencia sp.]